MLNRVLAFSVLLTLFLLPAASQAEEWDLNVVLSGDGIESAPSSFGTITLTQAGDAVNLMVDLIGDSIHKVHKVFLNFDDGMFDNSSPFLFDGEAIGVDEDAQKADGYKDGLFDLQILPTGSLGTEPISGLITLDGGSLTVADLTHMATGSDELFAAVHIGDFGGEPGMGGEDSIWVGASTRETPEPASFLLCGLGLIGIGLASRRKRNS